MPPLRLAAALVAVRALLSALPAASAPLMGAPLMGAPLPAAPHSVAPHSGAPHSGAPLSVERIIEADQANDAILLASNVDTGGLTRQDSRYDDTDDAESRDDDASEGPDGDD